jgi:serine/threonine protein kinase
MKIRRDWNDLPEGARRTVEHKIGKVLKADSTPGGRNSELSETLWTDNGPVFCKGSSSDSKNSYMHQNEISVCSLLPDGLAPRLLWHFETDGWLLLGFEHLSGQHADLSPDSQHLPLVAEAVDQISRIAVPSTSGARRPMSEQWARALKRESEFSSPVSAGPWSAANAELVTTWATRAPSYMDGSSLIHSDLNPGNVLVSDRAQVIDWAWWQTGTAWFDPAYLVIRLIATGHDPESAEKWARQFDGFAAAPPEAITAFAASALRVWERRFPDTPATSAARSWAQYRLN